MKFAAPYQTTPSCPISYDNIDEFNIIFTNKSSFDELEKFVNMYPNHRINIEFKESEDEYDIDSIIRFCHNHKNIYLRIYLWQLEYLEIYDDENINYFFDKSMAIYSYALLEWALNSNTKGIYIVDDLTYNLEEVYKQCSAKDIELRIILNRLPITNNLIATCPSIQVYRPQDYNFLSKYYSVGEFDCGDNYDWGQAEILYKKWYIDHSWDDDLEFMNQDLMLPYPTRSIPPELTRLRSVCQHRCTMRSENLCSKCKRLLLLGYQNADNNIIYTDPEYGLPSLEEMVDTIILSKNNNES